MILCDEIASIDYSHRVHRVVFQGLLHKRVSRPSFPQFRVPRICRCFFRQSKAFFSWHCRHWKLYDDGIFVYFASDDSERPLGGVKLDMTDMPLSTEMQRTVACNLYPAQVDVTCRLTIPSATRVLHLFSEDPEECARLREQITIIVNNMRQIQSNQITQLAIESKLYRTNSVGSLLADFSVADSSRQEDDVCSSTDCSYNDIAMEQLREMFGCAEHAIVDEKKRQVCEEIGVALGELMAENMQWKEEVEVRSDDSVAVSSSDVELAEKLPQKHDLQIEEICGNESKEQVSL